MKGGRLRLRAHICAVRVRVRARGACACVRACVRVCVHVCACVHVCTSARARVCMRVYALCVSFLPCFLSYTSWKDQQSDLRPQHHLKTVRKMHKSTKKKTLKQAPSHLFQCPPDMLAEWVGNKKL